MKVIGVRFKSTKKIYYFNPNGFDIKKYDNVIVETSRGIEFGQTVIGIRDVPEDEIVQPLQNVVRIATPEDEKNVKLNEERQKEAFEKCKEKIEKHQLDMKLVDAEYTFDGTKLIFYFTSDGRVDFRELVKDLAIMFKTRIELRQIAVRDETKMLGGLGACGNEICCKKFLGDFASVSIKMAKEQNLSLNPTKISGLCGRLICCLNFEKDFYNEMNQKLPAVDEMVMSPKGTAQVVSTYPLKESVRVKYTNPDGSTDTATFHLNEITRINPETKKFDADDNDLMNRDLSPEELAELAEPEKNAVSVMTKPKHKIRNNRQKTENKILSSELLESGVVPDGDDENKDSNSSKKTHKKRKPKHTEENAVAEGSVSHIDESSNEPDEKDQRPHHEKNHSAKKHKPANKNKATREENTDATANAEQSAPEHKKQKKPRPAKANRDEAGDSAVKKASDAYNTNNSSGQNPTDTEKERNENHPHKNDRNKKARPPKQDNQTNGDGAPKGSFKKVNKSIKIQERSANVKPTEKKAPAESNQNE